MDRNELSRQMKLQIADWLTEDMLPVVNPKVEKPHVKHSFYVKYGKRFFDIVLSLFAIIVTLPINLVIMVITFFDVGRPIFFLQERVGKDGKLFKIVKFRNMRNTTDEKGELLPPSQRVTKWGKFVRKTSLDELLNFYSVFKGDMSIIGPRPLIDKYYPRYNDRHLARFAVRPGLECPPRDGSTSLRTWQDQFENDIWYVENVSFLTDCKMVINLVKFALDHKNSTQRGTAVRGGFIGYSEDGRAIDLSEVPESYIERVVEYFQQQEAGAAEETAPV